MYVHIQIYQYYDITLRLELIIIKNVCFLFLQGAIDTLKRSQSHSPLFLTLKHF